VEEVVAVTRALVDIDSVSGNEKAAGDYVAALLAAENYTVERQVLEAGKRENILAYRPGNRTNARLLINRCVLRVRPFAPHARTHADARMHSHIDVVPPWFPSSEDDTYIYGRGCVDAKGQIAPQVLAVRNLRARGALREDDVAFLYVVGEEVDHSGMKLANEVPPRRLLGPGRQVGGSSARR
jgi:acetylornithine deacetylase